MHISILWPWLFWTWIASEIALAISTHTRPSEGKTQDRGSIFILWTAIAGSIAASSWTHGALRAANFSGSPWLGPLTVVLLAAALIFRWSAILSLGKSFSVNVAIQKSQTVYRAGLYRVVRHPSYLGILVIFLAVGLRSRNWAGLAIMLVVPGAAILYRIRVEETALEEAFGSEYTAYCKVTRRLIPGIF